MSFRFNFTDNSNDDDSVSAIEDHDWHSSKKVVPTITLINKLDDMIKYAKMYTCGDLEIGHIDASNAISNMYDIELENATKLAKEKNSDLIVGKYEGGLKIWECTKDLIEFLLEHEDILMNELNVLDLGCGAGILGIYAFLKGAFVTFQDYNEEVLEYVTIPNVLLNIEDEDKRFELIQRCNFWSGDWASFNENLDHDILYDLIVTSETIYNEKNYDKLVQVFAKRLKPKGIILLAAKTCYFGVGGGLRQFENAINKTGIFQCEVCWKNTEGVLREILKIKRK